MFLLNIIDKQGSIPWKELNYPEGRTAKACQRMIQNLKENLKNGDSVSIAPKTEQSDQQASMNFSGRKQTVPRRGRSVKNSPSPPHDTNENDAEEGDHDSHSPGPPTKPTRKRKAPTKSNSEQASKKSKARH